MVPHVHVHCGSHDDRSGSRQIKSCQEVWSNALRKFGEHIGRSRNYYEGVDGLRNRDVLYGRVDIRLLVSSREHFSDYFFTGKRCEGKRPDEFLGRTGHDDLHPYPAVLQQANDFRRLVRRNAARDTKSYFHEGLRNSARVLTPPPNCPAFPPRYRPLPLGFPESPISPCRL